KSTGGNHSGSIPKHSNASSFISGAPRWRTNMPFIVQAERDGTRSSRSQAFAECHRVSLTTGSSPPSTKPITPSSCGASTTCWRADGESRGVCRPKRPPQQGRSRTRSFRSDDTRLSALGAERRVHRSGDAVHPSEPLARLLAWCQRRPLTEQYPIKAEADGTFRLVSPSGRRGQAPHYVGDERYATVEQARHGAFLRHISDLTEK